MLSMAPSPLPSVKSDAPKSRCKFTNFFRNNRPPCPKNNQDVSATAIYGSRGAHGVIIITTKKGNNDRTLVRYKTTLTVSTPAKKLEMLNATEWARMEKDYFGNRGGYTDDEVPTLR